MARGEVPVLMNLTLYTRDGKSVGDENMGSTWAP
jgi:hypothetical protein